ncbi:PKD domain-containing protein [Halorussus lipolyticus]|uniref:PKD domain-containing protein n=1 Tax=Halorussus lipolyticus TaxID=3034024 RepID=UPI0023E8B577|nr:PKD domain-containing protein [Halorussus sp. DT80]
MNDQARSVLLALLLVVSSVSVAGVGAAAPSSSPSTFHVTQGGECYEVAPVGDGTTSVEEFYDYQAPGPGYLYGSYGEGSQRVQQNQVSHVFVYRGSQGLSLVMLHDDLNRSQGGGITFDISGLPQDHQWLVEDDDYEGRDDNFQYDGTSAKIDWMWSSGRTDGGVVRGLGNDFSAITIDPAFGEESWAYQERTKNGEPAPWPYATNDTSWQLQSGTGDEIPLDKTQSLSLSKGKCPDETNPQAALSASPNPVANDESVTFDASDSADNRQIAEYRWDFDDDGTIERTTDSATIQHTYASTGTYTASVTVVDGNGNTDTATETVEVDPAESPDPTVTVDAPATVNVSETFEASASASDESKVESYQWDFGSTTKTGGTVTHSYAEEGDRTVTLTWTETDGETHTETTTIDVVARQNVTYLNATAVKVTGSFDSVDLTYGFYTQSGYGQSHKVVEDISGPTVITVPDDEGVNGTMINLVSAYESSQADPVLQKQNPRRDYYAETIEPEPVTISVESVEETGEGTYNVTFGYDNPNEEVLDIPNSTLSGNVTGDAPTTFESSDHTVTVTWTPDSDDERATWTLNRSRFDQSTVTASTPPASEVGDDSDTTAPDAALVAVPSFGSVEETEFVFNASESADDRGIAAYHWDLDADGEFETTTTESRVATTYSEPGRREVAVMVEDAAGNTDTATTNVSVSELKAEQDLEVVNATAVEVTGEFAEVTLTTTHFTQQGVQTATHTYDDNISNTTLLSAPDGGVWGPVVQSAEAFENASDSEAELTAENADYSTHLAEARPEKVSTFVEDAEQVSNDTYEVTFGYHNPNDAAMVGVGSAFSSGSASPTPPERFESGRHTFTVTWTPDSDDANLVWESDLSNFGYGASTATSPTPSQIEAGEMPPTAALNAAPTTVAPGEEVAFDASASLDPEGENLTYRWDLDGDDDPEETTDSATLTRSFSETGTQQVAVTVVDESGQTDTATEIVTVREQSSDDAPNAKLTAPDSGSMSQLLYPFDASASTDDEGIVAYRWDFDSDGEVEWTEEDAVSSFKPYQVLDEPGTYEATVTVVDTAGQTDSATVEYTVTKVVPDAAIHASSTTVEVGENVTLEASDFNEKPGTLAHVCWKVGDEAGPDGTTWTTSFDEAGDKTVTLVLRDRAGYENVVTKTITVTADDSGGSDDGNSDDPNPGEGGLEDDDNDDSTGGGLPSQRPSSTGGQNQNGGNDDGGSDAKVSAPLNSSDGQVGTVTLRASGSADPAIDVADAAPRNVTAPTAEDEGFAALSYLSVSGGDRATFTVSKGVLNASGATAGDVTLFRDENGTWTATETSQVGQTDDAYRFGANVSEGTYAVGIDRPATSVADLSLGSKQVEPGRSVTVTATVENTGRADGTHEVVLTVGGEAVSTKTVSVEAGETAEATFSVSLDSGGTYEVGVGDATADLVVESAETTTTEESDSNETTTTTATSDGPVPGFGVGVTLVALLAAGLVALRRR